MDKAAKRRAIELLAEARKRGLISPPDVDVYCRQVDFAPDDWQNEIIGYSGDMLLNCSRQAGKSTTASHKAVYTARYKANQTILIISPTLRQSGELFKKVRRLLKSLGLRLVEDNALSCSLENSSRIISLPGTEETIRGYTADLVIVDEAARVAEALFAALSPMLAVSRGVMMMMSTPFGKRGQFWHEWSEGGSRWKRIEVPATKISRISPEFLEQERKSLGEWWYLQEYMCQFQDATDSIFSYDAVMGAFNTDVTPLFGVVPVDADNPISNEVEALCFS